MPPQMEIDTMILDDIMPVDSNNLREYAPLQEVGVFSQRTSPSKCRFFTCRGMSWLQLLGLFCCGAVLFFFVIVMPGVKIYNRYHANQAKIVAANNSTTD